VVGKNTCDVTAHSTASVAAKNPLGFVGLSSFPIDK
jgi:hypothetical protein